jgi:phosphoglycolate phosphatase-like HAD superfamily hydrolase
LKGPAIFWDLDGPILDVSGKYYAVYRDLVRARGGVPLEREDYWNRKRTRESDEAILALSGLHGWTEEYRELRRTRIETDAYAALDRVWPPIPALLARLAHSWTLVLVTLRNERAPLLRQLDRLALRPHFRSIITAAGEGGDGKRGQLKAAAVRGALGTVPSQGWFIGDTETDSVAGRSLGMRTALVTFGIRTRERLEQLSPDVLMDDPEALATWGSTL